MSRAHMQKGEHSRRLGKHRPRRRPRSGPKWAQVGQANPFRGSFAPPFDLVASRTIYSTPAKEPHMNSFVIRHRGAEKRGTPSRRGEGRASCLGFPADVGTLHGRPRRSSRS
jgi:hypothetical protein